MQDFVHHILEGSRGVSKPKRHNGIFKMAIAGSECRFPFITFLDSNEIVAVLKVEFGKDRRFRYSVTKF